MILNLRHWIFLTSDGDDDEPERNSLILENDFFVPYLSYLAFFFSFFSFFFLAYFLFVFFKSNIYPRSQSNFPKKNIFENN